VATCLTPATCLHSGLRVSPPTSSPLLNSTPGIYQIVCIFVVQYAVKSVNLEFQKLIAIIWNTFKKRKKLHHSAEAKTRNMVERDE